MSQEHLLYFYCNFFLLLYMYDNSSTVLFVETFRFVCHSSFCFLVISRYIFYIFIIVNTLGLVSSKASTSLVSVTISYDFKYSEVSCFLTSYSNTTS